MHARLLELMPSPPPRLNHPHPARPPSLPPARQWDQVRLPASLIHYAADDLLPLAHRLRAGLAAADVAALLTASHASGSVPPGPGPAVGTQQQQQQAGQQPPAGDADTAGEWGAACRALLVSLGRRAESRQNCKLQSLFARLSPSRHVQACILCSRPAPNNSFPP
jgi:hypothetical protein